MNIQIMLSLLNTLEQLRKHEGWNRQQLEAHQAKGLQDLRRYAYERSPFYQKFHKGLTERPLHELPVLTKAMMMEHYDELVTDRSLHLEEIRASATEERLEKHIKASTGSMPRRAAAVILASFSLTNPNGCKCWLPLPAPWNGRECGST